MVLLKKCTVIANYGNTTHFIASIAIVLLVLFSYVLLPIAHNIAKYCSCIAMYCYVLLAYC